MTSQIDSGSANTAALDLRVDTLSLQIDSLKVPLSRTSTASDTIDLADKRGFIYMNLAGANNLTVVAESIKEFDVDDYITVVNWGAGQTTIVAGAGVTINSAGGALDLRVQYSSVTLVYKGSDIWLLIGDIS